MEDLGPLMIRHASGDLFEVTCGLEQFTMREHEIIELVCLFRHDGTEEEHVAFARDLRVMREGTWLQ